MAREHGTSGPGEGGASRDDASLAVGRAAAGTGALAAALLEKACGAVLARAGSPRVEEVRSLAGDLRARLEAVTGPGGRVEPGLLAEAPLRCADLANLAACNADVLPPGAAEATVHLCAGVVRALSTAVEAGSAEGEPAENALRDARSALWRAELAVRQVGEADP